MKQNFLFWKSEIQIQMRSELFMFLALLAVCQAYLPIDELRAMVTDTVIRSHLRALGKDKLTRRDQIKTQVDAIVMGQRREIQVYVPQKY